ncbi:MAG: ATP-binding cassette domain-containing protein [Eubacteriales bacterium]|nr:ATP-binding cassette domain-containing protein [Eubacteriales bacterium]
MIQIKNLTKSFNAASLSFDALHNVNLTINDKDIFGIIGMSGAGKSTLIRCINRLEEVTDGQIIIDNVDIKTLSKSELRKKRREITMIFQSFNLLMQKNVLSNVCFPLYLEKVTKKEAEKKAKELLSLVGLEEKIKAFPSQLSGGQKQRVAIARALATNPKVLLCDEATSALDPTTTQSILKLLKEINEKLGITIIIITHQMSVVEQICKHVAILDNGSIVEVGEVGEVFSHPKEKATKKLVFPEGNEDAIVVGEEDEHFIRIVFSGHKATKTPLIAKLALEERIEANIASASTRTINGNIYGSMLLGIRGDYETLGRAKNFLIKNGDVRIEEVNIDVK